MRDELILSSLGPGPGERPRALRDRPGAALRLDPRGPQVGAFWTTMGFARLLIAELDAASDSFERARAANPKLPRAKVGAAISLALRGELPAAQHVAAELLRLLPHYRLSQTMDRCLAGSPPRYQAFYDEVLSRGSSLAGLPV